MKFLRFSAAAVALVVMAACGAAPTKGTVTDRHFEAEHTKYVPGHCQSRSQNGLCTFQTPTTYRNVPAKWELKLRSGDDEGWRTVTQSDYDTHPIGSTYDCGCS